MATTASRPPVGTLSEHRQAIKAKLGNLASQRSRLARRAAEGNTDAAGKLVTVLADIEELERQSQALVLIEVERETLDREARAEQAAAARAALVDQRQAAAATLRTELQAAENIALALTGTLARVRAAALTVDGLDVRLGQSRGVLRSVEIKVKQRLAYAVVGSFPGRPLNPQPGALTD